jgi:hypothetical protein
MIGHTNLTMRTVHMITTIIALVYPLLRMCAIDPLPALDLLLALILLPMLATVPLLVIALDPLLVLVLLHVLATVPLLAPALIHLLVPVIIHLPILARRHLLLALPVPLRKPTWFALRNLQHVRKRTGNLTNLWTNCTVSRFENDLMLSSMLAAFIAFLMLPKAFLNLSSVNLMLSRTLLLQ